MARIRSIHPDAWQSEKLSEASDGAERLFWRLLPQCDDDGRCEAHARLLASTLFPLREEVTADVVERWLDELARLDLIVLYEALTRRWLEVGKWSVYQHPRKKLDSKIPAPVREGYGTGTAPVANQGGRGSRRRGVGVDVGEEGEGSGEGDGRALALVEKADRIARARGGVA